MHSFNLSGILAEIATNPIQLTILLILVAMSLASLTIGVERFIYFKRMRGATLSFLPSLSRAFGDEEVAGALDRAITETRAPQHRASHLAQVLSGGLHEFRNKLERPATRRVIACKRALERSSVMVVADLRRGLVVLATVAASAPFVGLLGTVFGVINSFQAMGADNSTGIDSIATGISEALFMTGLGLAVALPAVWLFNYFGNSIEYYEAEIENSASELVDALEERCELEAEALAC